MAATKSPISLDPLTVSDGAPGRNTWAFVQTGCTNPVREGTLHNRVRSSTGAGPASQFIQSILSMRPENLQGRRCRICAPRVHNERAKRETAPSCHPSRDTH